MKVKVKVKWSRYRPGVAQRVGRGIALLFHDRGTRRGWVVSSTPRPHFTPGKDPVPILQEAGWAAGPVWAGGKSRPHRDSIPDRPVRSHSLYRLRYAAHNIYIYIYLCISQNCLSVEGCAIIDACWTRTSVVFQFSEHRSVRQLVISYRRVSTSSRWGGLPAPMILPATTGSYWQGLPWWTGQCDTLQVYRQWWGQPHQSI